MIKVVHLTDLHLKSANRQKAVDSIRFAHDQIWRDEHSLAYRPDLILVTGDATDRSIALDDPDLAVLFEFVNACRCPIAFLQGTPSHEPPELLARLGQLQTAAGITPTILSEPGLFTFSVLSGAGEKRAGIQVAALPAITQGGIYSWFAQEMGAELEKHLSLADVNALIREHLPNLLRGFAAEWSDFKGPKILVGHTTVAGCKEASGYSRLGDDIEVTLQDLALAEADAILLGHIHRAQSWDDFGLVSYGGSSHPVNWGEDDQKSFSVFWFNDEGGLAAGHQERIPYPHLPLVKISIEFTGGTEYEITSPPQLDKNRELKIEDDWPEVPEFLTNGKSPGRDQLVQAVEAAPKPAAVRVRYTIPQNLRDTVNDRYILGLVAGAGLDPETVVPQRIIRSEQRRETPEIGTRRSAWEMYLASCEAKAQQPRPGVQAKAENLESLT